APGWLLRMEVPLQLRKRNSGQYKAAAKRDDERLRMCFCADGQERPDCGGSYWTAVWAADSFASCGKQKWPGLYTLLSFFVLLVHFRQCVRVVCCDENAT